MPPFRPRTMALAAATSLAALGACGSDNAGPLDDRQVDELGAALRDEVETAVGGFSVRGILLPFSERMGSNGGPALAALPLCADGAPSAASNDGDPVPDSVVFTFTVPPCTYDDVRDGRVEVTGTVEIVDPTPATAGFEYLARLANLAYRYVTPDLAGNYTVIRNGTRYRGGDATGLTVTANLQIQRALADFDADVAQNWTATFTPAAGATAATTAARHRRHHRDRRHLRLEPARRVVLAHRLHTDTARVRRRLHRYARSGSGPASSGPPARSRDRKATCS